VKHVLVVDDDAALRIAMAEWISEDGFEVHPAENGAVALQEMPVSPGCGGNRPDDADLEWVGVRKDLSCGPSAA
jgi:CheY-like chemotaxis protein